MIQFRLPALQLPDLCRGTALTRAIVLAQAIAVVLAFAPGIEADPWLRLGVISLFVHWVVLLTLLLLCLTRNRLNQLSPVWLLLSCISIFELVTLGVSAVAHSWLSQQHSALAQSLSGLILANLMIGLILAIIAILFFVIHSERNQQVKAQSQAEFTALQARIEPHFLFNSLNTVAELTQVDANAAEQALLDLAALFRAALHAGETVLLEEELKLSRQYLAIEQWRLGDRLQVVWQLPAQIPKVRVPALTIQPLLENAVRHGVEPSIDNVVLTITLLVSRQSVTFVLTNPLSATEPHRKGNGVALQNIRQRLQLHFGTAALLHASVADNCYRVKLVLPITEQT